MSTFTSAKYDLPGDDRLPEFAHALAAESRAARAAWFTAEDRVIDAQRAANRAGETYAAALRAAAAEGASATEVTDQREMLAAEVGRARDLARVARERAEGAYWQVCQALIERPDEAVVAADELPQQITQRIAALLAELAEAREDLRQSLPARAWISRVLKPRAGHQAFDAWAGPRVGHAATPGDDALEQIRNAERKRLVKHEGLYGRAASTDDKPANAPKVRVT